MLQSIDFSTSAQRSLKGLTKVQFQLAYSGLDGRFSKKYVSIFAGVLLASAPQEGLSATIILELRGEVTSSTGDPSSVGERVDVQLEYDPNLFANFDRFAREDDTTFSLKEDDPDGEFRVRVDGRTALRDQVVNIRMGNNIELLPGQSIDALVFSNEPLTFDIATNDPNEIFIPEEPGKLRAGVTLGFSETVLRPRRPGLIEKTQIPNEAGDFGFSRSVDGVGTIRTYDRDGTISDLLTFAVDPGSVTVREDAPNSNFLDTRLLLATVAGASSEEPTSAPGLGAFIQRKIER